MILAESPSKSVKYSLDAPGTSHYPRTEDEGRTLIQTALRSSASIEPTKEELRVTLALLSSPHRSRAIASICEVLNKTETTFPGTKLRLRFEVAEPPI